MKQPPLERLIFYLQMVLFTPPPTLDPLQQLTHLFMVQSAGVHFRNEDGQMLLCRTAVCFGIRSGWVSCKTEADPVSCVVAVTHQLARWNKNTL